MEFSPKFVKLIWKVERIIENYRMVGERNSYAPGVRVKKLHSTYQKRSISTCTTNSKAHGFAFSHLVPHSNKKKNPSLTSPHAPRTHSFHFSQILSSSSSAKPSNSTRTHLRGPHLPENTTRGAPGPWWRRREPCPPTAFLFCFLYFLFREFIIMRGELFFRGFCSLYARPLPVNSGQHPLALPVPWLFTPVHV